MVVVPNQVGASTTSQSYVQQQNFGQIIGEITNWNPNADPTLISVWVNNIVRKIYDRRNWYGTMVKGQIVTPAVYQAGQAAVTLGSTSVQGSSGTGWTTDLVGRSFRIGYIYPIYNIVAVDVLNQVLTLEMPWGGPNLGPISYFIVQQYYSIPNIRYIFTATNLQMYYRMWTNLTQNSLDNIDPPRQRIYYPWALAGMPPDANGNFQVELYPASMVQQAFPYRAYVQKPNLVDDEDTLPPYIRTDIVVTHGIANALQYRPKSNPYYSESLAIQLATEKMAEFNAELMVMENTDEGLYRQDIVAPFETFPYYQPGGAMLAAISPASSMDSGGAGWGWGDE